MSVTDRHSVVRSTGPTDPGCDRGELIAQQVGFREGLRQLAKAISRRIELAETVNVEALHELIDPYLEDHDDYTTIPRAAATPYGSVPDHLYPRAAQSIRSKIEES